MHIAPVISFLLCLTGCMGMFVAKRLVTPQSVPRARTKTGLMVLDQVLERHQKIRPFIDQLQHPIRHGKKSSSWYHEKIDDEILVFPEYLIAFARYYKELVALRNHNLMEYANALKSNKPEGMKDWIARTSNTGLFFGLSTTALRINRLDLLNMMVLAKKMDQEQREILSEYIEKNLVQLDEHHRNEIYDSFMDEFWKIETFDDRFEILETVGTEFIKLHLIHGIYRLQKNIKSSAPSIDIPQFLDLWYATAKHINSNNNIPLESKLEAASSRFRQKINQHPDEQLRSEMSMARNVLMEHLEDTEEFYLFLGMNDETIDPLKDEINRVNPLCE